MSRPRWAAIVVGVLALLALAPMVGAASPPLALAPMAGAKSPPTIVISFGGKIGVSSIWTATNTETARPAVLS